MTCSKCGSDAAAGNRYCTQCGQPLDGTKAESPQGRSDLATLNELRERLSEIEAKLPESNVINARFWPRAFTVFGHYVAALLVIYAGLFVIFLFFMLVVAVVGIAAR